MDPRLFRASSSIFHVGNNQDVRWVISDAVCINRALTWQTLIWIQQEIDFKVVFKIEEGIFQHYLIIRKRAEYNCMILDKVKNLFFCFFFFIISFLCIDDWWKLKWLYFTNEMREPYHILVDGFYTHLEI